MIQTNKIDYEVRPWWSTSSSLISRGVITLLGLKTEEVDYIENWTNWMCTQALLVTVIRNLSKQAFWSLSRFPILTLNAPVTLKTKKTCNLKNLHTKLQIHPHFNDKNLLSKPSRNIQTPSTKFRNESVVFRVCFFQSNHVLPP